MALCDGCADDYPDTMMEKGPFTGRLLCPDCIDSEVDGDEFEPQETEMEIRA